MIIVLSVAIAAMLLYFSSCVTRQFYTADVRPKGGSDSISTAFSEKIAQFLRRYLTRGGVFSNEDLARFVSRAHLAIVVFTGVGLLLPLVFTDKLTVVFSGMGIGSFTGVVVVLAVLETRRRAFRAGILHDFPFFAQQLIMVSLSGDTLEEGLRKIAQVSVVRSRSGAIERLIRVALGRRRGHRGLEDELIAVADQAGASEVQRAIRGKVESDRYGSAVSPLLRDLVAQAKISAIKLRYFAAPRILHLQNRERQRDSQMTWRFLLFFSQQLATSLDVMTSLRRCVEMTDSRGGLKDDLIRLEQRLKEGTPEEECLAQFGGPYKTVGLDLLVQALLLSKRSPKTLREMLQEILQYLKEEGYSFTP
jgi:hypothetical protein